MDEQILKQIADTFKKAIQTELLVPRIAKTYSGVQKPISGKFRYGATPPKASGTLYNSVNVYWEADLEDAQPNLVLDFGNNDYWYYVDEGRRPGKYPPLAPIAKWVTQKKGLQGIRDAKGRFLPRKSLIYLFRRSIGLYGYAGTNFIEKAYNKTINQIEEQLGEAAVAYIERLFDEGRIFPRSDFNRP